MRIQRGKWSERQDLNLQQVIDLADSDSDRKPYSRGEGGEKGPAILKASSFPARDDPAYFDGFYDACDGEPLFPNAAPIYACGWHAYWECRALLSIWRTS